MRFLPMEEWFPKMVISNMLMVTLEYLLNLRFLAQFSSVQSLSAATPWIAARQASLPITNSQSLPKLMSIKSVMPASYHILCRPLLLLAPSPPCIRVFSNKSTLHMRWPKYWGVSASASVLPMNTQDWSPLGWNTQPNWNRSGQEVLGVRERLWVPEVYLGRSEPLEWLKADENTSG